MIEELRELWRFRELLFTMVQRDMRIRYKNSVLGFLWSFLNPLVTTAVYTFVFGVLNHNEIESYSLYVLAAYLPWMFFQFSILDASQSILVALPLVKKIYFPREILPLAAVISNLIHLMLGWVVFFLFAIATRIIHPPTFPIQQGVVLLPLLMLISFMISTGCALIVSALNTFYEDVKFIATVGLNLLFFLSPVVYFSETVGYSHLNNQMGGKLYNLYHLSPIAALSTAYRKSLLAPQDVKFDGVLRPSIPLANWYLYYSFGVGVILMIGGYALFNRCKWRFVERP